MIPKQSIIVISTPDGALMLSRSVENPELATRILDITRDFLKQQAD